MSAAQHGIYRGKEGVEELFKPIFEALSDREVQINQVIEAGDTIVVDFTFRGRQTGPFATPQGPLQPTGKVLGSEMIAIYELRDGKLAGSRGMYDRLGLAAQLGLLPAPARECGGSAVCFQGGLACMPAHRLI